MCRYPMFLFCKAYSLTYSLSNSAGRMTFSQDTFRSSRHSGQEWVPTGRLLK